MHDSKISCKEEVWRSLLFDREYIVQDGVSGIKRSLVRGIAPRAGRSNMEYKTWEDDM